MINSRELKPLLAAMQEATGMKENQMKEVFLTIALFAHGYASLIANNSLAFDETVVSTHLERAYRGAAKSGMEDSHDKVVG